MNRMLEDLVVVGQDIYSLILNLNLENFQHTYTHMQNPRFYKRTFSRTKFEMLVMNATLSKYYCISNMLLCVLQTLKGAKVNFPMDLSTNTTQVEVWDYY